MTRPRSSKTALRPFLGHWARSLLIGLGYGLPVIGYTAALVGLDLHL
jgi:hypothetical protein